VRATELGDDGQPEGADRRGPADADAAFSSQTA